MASQLMFTQTDTTLGTPSTQDCAIQPCVALYHPSLRRSGSIEINARISIRGPLEISGGVKANGSIHFDGDFAIRDNINAYGAIHMRGNIACG